MHQTATSFPTFAGNRLRTSAPCPGQLRSRARGSFSLTLLLCILAFVSMMPSSLVAQTFTAAITGTVTDQTGAAVSGAQVEIRNTGTNE